MIEVEKIGGIGEFEVEELYKVSGAGDRGEDAEKGEVEAKLYKVCGGKAFLVDREKTIEVRTDGKLAKLLMEKYESVMGSRYFGKGGIEVVMSGQLQDNEIEDLVRLSYNLTANET